ncbi:MULTISPECIES: dolichyl-phosphate-mannose--protein mannosyltransferase [Actinomyces]|uniref:Polyprenol-phosphate-mannose--protein mannosyltransferase n=1 Tax=Actinomyces oris TaxID=544580 RepID=A0A1Q8VGP7_9ACTO|nr:phospholipid carrier-dependent glycosyltransferase [Actinomyces oris]OLO47263.1 phospholipid carrier-dependent glycosyltransferase [Actinomyces oris]
MTTPSALSPEQSPEQSRDGSSGPDVEQERAQEPTPRRDEATDSAPAEPAVAERTEAELRTLLGLGPVDDVMPRAVRVRGWVVTGVVGVIAALLRLIGLNHPKTLMFDEIYYVKDAYSLWRLGYEGSWAHNSDAAFAAGDFSGLSDEAAYVVHPQLGKWLIGAGMEVFGPESPFGWRIMPAIAGILTVMLLARLTMRLTRSPLLAGLAGLLLAIDGVALTESRIGLLDVFIGFFATVTLYCLVRDREWSRARLARKMAGTSPGARAPHATIRPWLLAAGIALGLTCSIKWSGLYLVAASGIVVVTWDTLALRRVRARAWFLEGTVAQGVSDFLQTIPVVVAVYVGCWWSWFTHPSAYMHGWTLAEPNARSQVPAPWLSGYVSDSVFQNINDFIAYHQRMYTFHVGLAEPHTYQSKPSGWLLQTRPTSFFWQDKAQVPQTCWGGDCIQAITSIGNIVIWWSAVAALAAVVIIGVKNRDWRVWVPLIGYLGLYVPWFQYRDRTIFTFYTVAFVPCVVLVLVLALGMSSGLLPPLPGSRSAQAQMEALRRGQIGPGIRPWRGVGARFLGFGPQFGRTPVWTPPVVETDPGMYRISTAVADADDALESGTGPRTDTAQQQAYAELTGYPAPSTSSEGTATPEPSDDGAPQPAGRRRPWSSLSNWTMAPTWQIRTEGISLIIVVTLLACAAAAFWWPIWTGQTVSRSFWLYHMFLSSWV